MRREKRNRYFLMAAGAALTVLIVAGFVFLLSQRREHDRTLMEFEALQAAAGLVEYLARSGAPDQSVLPQNVLGFGVYDAGGRAMLTLGSAPAGLPTGVIEQAPGSVLHRGAGRLRLLRPIGMTRNPRMGPMDRMPEGMRDRHMGPRGGMMMPDRGPANGGLLGAGAYLVLDYDVSDLLASTRTRLAYWTAIGVALLGLLAAVGVLAGRIRRYEEERHRREHLVQLGEAARTLAHEIRNPLGAIRLQTAMLRKRFATAGAGPAEPAQLDILDEEIGRIDALVGQVREFLQDPRGAPEDVELGELIRSLPARFSFPIEVSITCEPPCTVSFDRHRLHSVLGNVLRNAAEAGHASGQDGAVGLRVARYRDRLEIRITDTGPGLPEDADGERAFDPFYTRKAGGFGVGLAVSRRFVEAAGGSIALQNRRDGNGAECIIDLPEVHRDARSDR